MPIQYELDQLPAEECLLNKGLWKLYFMTADEVPALSQQLRTTQCA